MTETKNSTKLLKKSASGVVDKQSLYKHLYSLLLFDLLILVAAGLFSLIVRDLSCLWVILGIGQVIVLGSAIMVVREYSASLVVQKMKEKSAVVEPSLSKTIQEEGIDQRGNSSEFKIHATYAIDLPKLSANEQKIFDALSRDLKMEYVLWSVNIYLLLAAVLLWFDWDTYLFGIELIIFILCAFRLAAIGNDMKGAVAVPIPRHLTTREPRSMKIGLMLYMAFRAVLSVVIGRPNTFFLTTTASVFAITICISMLLYGLRGRVKRQGLPAVNLLALWVFGTQNIWDLLEYLILPVWRKLGNIFLIRGGEHILKQVSLWDSLRFLRGEDRIISKTPEQITQKLNEFHKKTNRTPEYQFNTLICGDNSWQFALHSLIDDADLVVMHLSNFSPSNQGCIYELEQLINRVPVENFYLLVDRHSTDYNFLLEKLQDLWSRMKSDSPNRRGQTSGIQIIFLEHAVKAPAEVEAIYSEMNKMAQDAMNVLEDTHKKELIMEHETRRTLELEGLFRVLLERAVQLNNNSKSNSYAS